MQPLPWSRNGVVHSVSSTVFSFPSTSDSSPSLPASPTRGFRSVYKIPLPDDEFPREPTTIHRGSHTVDNFTILLLLASVGHLFSCNSGYCLILYLLLLARVIQHFRSGGYHLSSPSSLLGPLLQTQIDCR